MEKVNSKGNGGKSQSAVQQGGVEINAQRCIVVTNFITLSISGDFYNL